MARFKRPAATSSPPPPLPAQGGQIPLARFFEVTYLPLKLRNRTPGYADIFRGAINWLRKALRREPCIADLNREALAATFELLADAGIGRSRVTDVRKRLVALWQFARSLGLAGPVDPPSACVGLGAPSRTWLDSIPVVGTLLDYYRRLFRPQLAADPGAPPDLSLFDSAINHYHDFTGEQSPLASIDDPALDAFCAWLLRVGGLSDHYARCQRGAIARIVRTVDPERLPRKSGPAPKLLAGERLECPAEPLAEPGTLRHFFDTVYRPERLLGKTHQTLVAYRRLFRRLRSFLTREPVLADLHDSLAASFFEWLADVDAPGTVNQRRALLFAIWRMAYDRGLVDRLPRVKKLDAPREEPDAWTAEEALRLITATDRLCRPPIAGIPAGPYWRALLLVCWWTALRRRSLFSLRRADVDFDRRTIYVQASGVKTRRGKRFTLGADALEALRAVWLPERELLFPTPSRASVAFAELLELAGIPSRRGRLNQFHKLRRTVATQATIHAGLPAAMALLDHSGPEVTKRYVDPSQLPANDATLFLPLLFGPPPKS